MTFEVLDSGFEMYISGQIPVLSNLVMNRIFVLLELWITGIVHFVT